MYQVRVLQLSREDLWSQGMIQGIYLNDAETTPLFCLGIVKKNHWEPLRVQGKIGYAYQSETYAQEVCANQSSLTLVSRNMHVKEVLPLAKAS